MKVYKPIFEALLVRGAKPYFQSEDQMVVCRQSAPAWPDAGNSFWISHKNKCWFLCTWAPICYRVPDGGDLIELCIDFLNFGGTAQWVVPDDLVIRYALAKLEEKEASLLFGWDSADQESC